MKLICKLLPLLFIAALALSACGKGAGESTTTAQSQSGEHTNAPADTRSLKEIADAVIAAVDAEFPTLVDSEVTEERFAYYFGIQDSSVATETYVREPMMSAIPFGIALLRVEQGQDAAALAKEMEKGINPARWVCVTASYVKAAVRGDVILLVLDDDAHRGEAIVSAFLKG